MSGNFADSNVLLYLVGKDNAKADIASQLLAGPLSISVQVLNELASVMLGKWRKSWDETDHLLALVRRAALVHALDQQTHDIGIEIAKRHRLGIYDSMIVAAAVLAGCDTLYSEDMQHGMRVGSRLTIIDPFR